MKSHYQKELINQMRKTQCNKNKKSSKLEAFKKEILILRHFKFSYKKIAHWLDSTYQVKASLSQIHHMINYVWKDDPFLETINKHPKT